MPGRKPGEAYEAFHHPLRVAASCLDASAHWAVDRSRNVGDVVQTSLNSARPLSLSVEDGRRLGLLGTISVEIIEDVTNGPYRVTTREVAYELVDLSSDSSKGERLVAWHYHPGGPGVTYPHMHLPKVLRVDDSWGIAKSHVPTGRVAFEDIVLYLIEELHVIPARYDFSEKLRASRDLHKRYRSW